eukprot:9384-Heterococcus_DN1.PRE.1
MIHVKHADQCIDLAARHSAHAVLQQQGLRECHVSFLGRVARPLVTKIWGAAELFAAVSIMALVPDALVWACIRDGNSFLVKRNGNTKRSVCRGSVGRASPRSRCTRSVC